MFKFVFRSLNLDIHVMLKYHSYILCIFHVFREHFMGNFWNPIFCYYCTVVTRCAWQRMVVKSTSSAWHNVSLFSMQEGTCRISFIISCINHLYFGRGVKECTKSNSRTRISRCYTNYSVLYFYIWMSIPVAEQSKARVCGRSLTGFAVSNPAGSMDVCVWWVSCVGR